MEKIAFILYLASIVIGVLFFGAIHTWAYTLVFLGLIAASLLLTKGAVVRPGASSPVKDGHIAGRPPTHLCWIKTDLDPLFFFFLVFLILQMVPLPPGLLGLISPDAKIAGDMSQPAAASLNPESLKGHWYAVAPYLYPVRMSLIRWTVYGLLFFGLIRCLNSRKRIEAAIVTILLLATFDSLYGILQTYSGHGHVWWFKSNEYGKDVSGTYLNRNLFAGFMEMTITLAIAYAAAGIEEGEKEHAGPGAVGRSRSLKKRFLAFFSESTQNHKRILIIFAGGVMGLGLILSGSRGGIIATAAALLMMGIVFYFRKGERRKGRIILLLFGIAMIFALHAGLDYTVGRFRFFDRDLEHRWVRAEKAIDLFKDYTPAGVGIGNFRHAYGKYQVPEEKNLYVDFAHNDYAQFLAEAGIAGALLLLAGLGWYAVRTLRRWRERSDSFAVCLGIAPIVALFALAIHAFSDYNLHRPAHIMVLVAVIAIGYAALHLESHRRHGRTQYRRRMIPLRPWGALFLIGAVGLILWSGVWTVRHFIAETYCSTDTNITLNLDQNPPPERLRKAIAWNPGNAVYPYKLGQAMMSERDRRMMGPGRDAEGWKRSHDPIIAEIERAIRLNPWNAEYHVRLGWEYSYLYDRPDHLTRWLPAADVCMNRAAWFAGSWPQNPRLQYDMGNYWTMRSKTFGPQNPRSVVAWAKAVRHYRLGMVLEKRTRLPEDVRGYLVNFMQDEVGFLRPFWIYPSKVADHLELIHENRDE
jgi:O-antigen ligase